MSEVIMQLSSLTSMHREVLKKVAIGQELTLREVQFAFQMERFGLIVIDDKHVYGAYLTSHGQDVYGQMFEEVT